MNFLNNNLKILNFTHIDLDGATSNIILQNYYNNVNTVYIIPDNESIIINKMIEEKNNYDAIIFTDFCPTNLTQIQAFNKPFMVLDHHESALKFNNTKNNIYIYPKYSASKLTYEFFNKNNKLKHLEDIVNITNDFDLYTLKDSRSRAFNLLYWSMGANWFIERFMNGETTLNNAELQYLVRHKNKFKKYYETLPIQELKNKGVVCEVERLYLSDVIEELKKDGYKWYILYRKNSKSLSIRSTPDSNINLLNVAKRLGKGGGHFYAIGVPIQKDNIMSLIKKIEQEIDNELNSTDSQTDFLQKLMG